MPGSLNVLELVQNGSLSAEMASTLWAAMDDRRLVHRRRRPTAGRQEHDDRGHPRLPADRRAPPRPDGRAGADGRACGVARRRLSRRVRVQRPHAAVLARPTGRPGLRHCGARLLHRGHPARRHAAGRPSQSCAPTAPSRTASSSASAAWCFSACRAGRNVPCAGWRTSGRLTASPAARLADGCCAAGTLRPRGSSGRTRPSASRRPRPSARSAPPASGPSPRRAAPPARTWRSW